MAMSVEKPGPVNLNDLSRDELEELTHQEAEAVVGGVIPKPAPKPSPLDKDKDLDNQDKLGNFSIQD
jgi:hypothetical protein